MKYTFSTFNQCANVATTEHQMKTEIIHVVIAIDHSQGLSSNNDTTKNIPVIVKYIEQYNSAKYFSSVFIYLPNP